MARTVGLTGTYWCSLRSRGNEGKRGYLMIGVGGLYSNSILLKDDKSL